MSTSYMVTTTILCCALCKNHPNSVSIFVPSLNIRCLVIELLTKLDMLPGLMDRPLPACCGLGGPYNFTFSIKCGSKGVEYCSDPSKYVNWDGIHMTEAAYKWISEGVLTGPYAIPPFNWSCLDSKIKNNESLHTQYSLMNS